MLRPPNTPVPGDTSLATIQSQPLRARFALRMFDQVFGFGGKADDEARALFAVRKGRENIGIFHERERRRALAGFFHFFVRDRIDAPVGDGGGAHRDIDRQRRLAAASISRAVST